MKSTSKRSLKPDIDGKKLGKNPFIEHLVVPVNKLALKDQYTVEKVKLDDGSMEKIYLPAFSSAESDEMTRVYTCSANRKDLSVLSARAKELYMFLLYNIDYNEDWVWLNRAMYMKENKVSAPNTFITARNELVTAGVISITVKKDVLHINPKYFFKGNRISKFGNQVKEK